MEKQKNIPQLRFPEFEGEWDELKIKNFTKTTAGGTPSTLKKEYWNGDIRWMNSGELNLKKVYDVQNKITQLGLNNSSSKLLPKNCVLIGLAGQGKTRGTIAINKIELCTNQSVASILPNEKFNSDFLYFNLDNRYEELRSLSAGEGGRGGLNLEIINNIKVPFPTLPEQTKIATFLTAVDEKIQALKKKKNLLEQYKKGVMQKIFSQQLRFKDDNGNEFPEWEEKKLGTDALFFSGGTPLTTNEIYYKGDIPFIKSGELNSEFTEQNISIEGLKNSSAKLVNKGDLLFALYGATSGEVGISKINGAINQAVLCIRSNIFINIFLYNYLQFSKEKIVRNFLQGGQGNLSAEIVKGLYIPTPSLNEQTKIANFLSAIDEKITRTGEQIDKIEKWKKGLLQKMFC